MKQPSTGTKPYRLLSAWTLVLAASISIAQAPSRGTAVVYPMVFDASGTPTSRQNAEAAVKEILKKGGFKLIDSQVAAKSWQKNAMPTPTSARPPLAKNLTRLGRAIGARYVVTSHVTFHTRSIWVNLGPKTISTCHMATTIIDSKTGLVVHEAEVDGRSDEKSDGLKIAAALLISPLVTAVSGGPKTPQETRAAQIAASRSLEKFVSVSNETPELVGTWQWTRFDGMDDRTTKVDDPSKYVLTLAENGDATGLADTNRFTTSYRTEGAALSFKLIASTKVAVPPGSLQDMFLNGLRDASSYVIRDGKLYISLKVDAGIMEFRRAK